LLAEREKRRTRKRYGKKKRYIYFLQIKNISFLLSLRRATIRTNFAARSRQVQKDFNAFYVGSKSEWRLFEKIVRWLRYIRSDSIAKRRSKLVAIVAREKVAAEYIQFRVPRSSRRVTIEKRSLWNPSPSFDLRGNGMQDFRFMKGKLRLVVVYEREIWGSRARVDFAKTSDFFQSVLPRCLRLVELCETSSEANLNLQTEWRADDRATRLKVVSRRDPCAFAKVPAWIGGVTRGKFLTFSMRSISANHLWFFHKWNDNLDIASITRVSDWYLVRETTIAFTKTNPSGERDNRPTNIDSDITSRNRFLKFGARESDRVYEAEALGARAHSAR